MFDNRDVTHANVARSWFLQAHKFELQYEERWCETVLVSCSTGLVSWRCQAGVVIGPLLVISYCVKWWLKVCDEAWECYVSGGLAHWYQHWAYQRS